MRQKKVGAEEVKRIHPFNYPPFPFRPAVVMVNTSSRFRDGGELGLGAKIGISSTRLHAYGPMGAEALTIERFVLRRDGR